MSGQSAFLLDASIFIFRYYFALPDHWHSAEGYGTGAVYGYTHWLRRLLLAERPSHIAACFDESLGSGFRHQLYPGYKSSRALADEALAFQLAACRQVSELLGVPCFASAEYEADDLIGTLAAHHRVEGRASTIVTRDKDLGQLLKPGDRLWHYPDHAPLHATDLEARWGLRLEQIPDYLALVGDKIDDIPGVPGIGIKTAVALLGHFGSVHELLDSPQDIGLLPLRGAKGLAAKIAQHAEQILLARQLATISCDVPLVSVMTERRPVDWDQLQRYTESLGFHLKFDADL